ncbi:MAG TPA: cytochrome c biogenesis protein CcdA [Armatimonadota bacterium]|nr:cytochrome c biogenesis protein CcdA [Armatimonadota bacterium]
MEAQNQPAWLVAVLAGVFSFISPCVLPLIPGYLSMISGLSVEQLEQRRAGHLLRIFFSCLLFSLGFSVVFIFVGLSVGTIGQWLEARRTLLNIVFGIVVILFGLFVVGAVRLPFLYQDRRLRLSRGSLGMWGAPLLGFAFGFGWTPCIGPWVVGLISVATGLSPVRAALLFAIFSASLGVCFTAAGLLFAYAVRAFAFLQRNYRAVEIVSGGILILIGILLLTQQWDRAVNTMNRGVGYIEQLL